jgi:hypothetical protein
MNELLSGVLFTGYLVVGLFFLRFWASSRDRLFAMFAASFWLLALQRLLIALTRNWLEDQSLLYLIRLLAFTIIVVAIVDKNRR